jgi:tetratricopeptide (TPR) repeat protein
MYKILIPVLFFTLFFSCKENKTKNKHDRYVKVYENALQMGDVNVAINACYEIIANDSSQTNYYDSLVYLYLNTSNQGSTYLAARRCLKYHPDDAKMTEVAANFAKDLGMPDTAIMLYRKTFVLTHKLKNLYDLAQVQYNMGNDVGAEETIDVIVGSPNSEKEKIVLSVAKDTTQAIPAKAAALNIKGVIFIQLGLKEQALSYFDEALKVAPEFKLAKQNRDDIISGKIKFTKTK